MRAFKIWLVLMGWVGLLVLIGTAASHAAPRHHRHAHHYIRPEGVPVAPSFWSAGSDVVAAARSQIGNGPVYGRRNLWCARFVNYILTRTGHHGTGSDMAKSFLSAPRTGMHVGAIAVMSRRGGGHVGVVSGVDAAGNPIVISGNNAGRVREAVYPRGRVLAFVEAQ